MNYAKMLGLAAVAAAALMAFVGASSASAATSTLCSAAQSPCEAANAWPAITAVIPGRASWREPGIHTPARGYGFRARASRAPE